MRIHVVLHQTLYPSNIGAAVRAMGNMGATRLILVDPQCPADDSRAKRAAVGCQQILEGRVTYGSWEEFYAREGDGLRIGFTARAGKLRPAQEAENLFSELKRQLDLKGESAPSPATSADASPVSEQNMYLVFGREDSGLSAADVEFLHHTCTLRTSKTYTSLNLSQAVLLALYVVRRYFPEEAAKKAVLPEVAIPTSKSMLLKPMFHPDQALKDWLSTLGFNISAKRINAYKVLNQLILRNRPTRKELRILEVVLRQNIRKLKERRADVKPVGTSG